MPNPTQRVLEAAQAVAFSLDLGSPHLLRLRHDTLFDAVIAWRVSRRAPFDAPSELAAASRVPGSIGLASAALRRRCRPHT